MRELDEDYNFRNHLKDIIKKEEIMKFYNYLEKLNINFKSQAAIGSPTTVFFTF